MKTLPIYLATITDANDGVYAISLVDYPATEVSWVAFKEDKEIQKFSIQDEEEHILCGVVMLADTNIYRRDGDYEYYIRYDKETLRKMAEKMLSDKTFNQIDLMHDGEIIPDGTVNLVELFIKDEAKGLNPTYLENIPDGSLLCTYKVNDEALWDKCKDGTFQGFSLAGYFGLEQAFNAQQKEENNNKNNISIMKKIKQMLAKMLLEMGAVATDLGVLIWEGEENLKEGDIVTMEDGSQPEDGDYKTEDGKVITVDDGKVAKIADAEAEVAPEEGESEEVSASKQKFEAAKAQFEASYQEVEQNIYSALAEQGVYAYLIENGSDYAIVSVWDAESDRERLFRYELSIDEEGNVQLGASQEVRIEYVPVQEISQEPEAEPEQEPEAAEEPSEVEQLRSQVAELQTKLAEIEKQPAAEPIVEQFEKAADVNDKVNPKLSRALKRVATLKH